MTLAGRAASFLDVKPDEGRSVVLMVLHSFAMGTSTVFFETAASALFLARFPSGLLPWVYIAAALVNTATGVGYSRLQERLSFRSLMIGTVSFLLACVVGLRAGLALASAASLVFGLLVFYRVLSALTDLEYWAVATRLYDVRQAKRLFGLVGSGEVLARIAGSFCVPLLVKPFGVANLIVLSAIGLLGCLLALLALLPSAAGGPAATPSLPPAAPRGSSLASLLGQPYLAFMLAMVATGVLGKYFVDYAFLAELKGHAADAKRLAAFFGLFSGATQAASLLIRLFVSGPLLSRFGIRVGLVVLPAVHLACTMLVVGAGVLDAGSAVFWLVILNQGAYKTLKHPIDNPSIKVLYQPLRREDRLAAQIAVETLITPVTVGLAGLVLLAFDAVARYDPVRFAWVMLPVFVTWLALARRGGSSYAAALVAALKGRLADAEALSLDDEKTLSTIRGVLEDGSPGDVVFALDLLDQTQDERSRALVVELLGHASPEVRRAAILRLEQRRAVNASGALLRLAAGDPDPWVRAAALTALAAIDGGAAGADALAAGLEDPHEAVRRGALIGLLRRDGSTNATASRRIETAATADADEERAWAAHVIGETGRSDFAPLLSALLEDRSLAVRRAAIPAAGKLHDPALWPHVARALGEPGLAGLATRALAEGGDAAAAALVALWDFDGRLEVCARAARALGRVGGGRATARLWAGLTTPHETVRHEAVAALVRCGHRPEERERGALRPLIEREAADAAWALAGSLDLRSEPGLSLVAEALATEAAQGRDRILLLLSLLEEPEPFLRVRSHLGDPSKEKRAYALEVLDLAVPSDLRGSLLPLFEDAGARPQHDTVLDRDRLTPVERIRAILGRSDEWTTPWTRAVAIHAAATQRLDVEADVGRIAASDGSALVAETARAMLERLRSGTREEKKPMLTIERVITLKAVDMFSRASEGVLAEVAGILEEVAVRAGDVVFEKGAAGDGMYIIVSGRVRVYDGDRTIGELGPRDIFGELALLDPEPRLASIAATSDAALLRLDREAFAELMAANIEIVRGVLHVLCERLRRASAERQA